MNLKKIQLSDADRQRVQELGNKLYNVCAGESLPVVLFALSAVKASVQACSKVMTQEDVDELERRVNNV